MAADIPVVSFGPFLSGSKDAQYEVAKQVYDAFSTVGFIYLKDHGIAQPEVNAMFKEVSPTTICAPAYLLTRHRYRVRAFSPFQKMTSSATPCVMQVSTKATQLTAQKASATTKNASSTVASTTLTVLTTASCLPSSRTSTHSTVNV